MPDEAAAVQVLLRGGLGRFMLGAVLLGGGLAACASTPPPVTTEPAPPAVVAPAAPEVETANGVAQSCIPFELPSSESLDFSPERVARLEEFALSDAPFESRAEARLRLARIFLHPDNPHADIERAVWELTLYSELLPEGSADPEARNLLAALRQLIRQKSETVQVRSEAERQKTERQRAIREIESCREDLRKLREVDIWLEKQKRGTP